MLPSNYLFIINYIYSYGREFYTHGAPFYRLFLLSQLFKLLCTVCIHSFTPQFISLFHRMTTSAHANRVSDLIEYEGHNRLDMAAKENSLMR